MEKPKSHSNGTEKMKENNLPILLIVLGILLLCLSWCVFVYHEIQCDMRGGVYVYGHCFAKELFK